MSGEEAAREAVIAFFSRRSSPVAVRCSDLPPGAAKARTMEEIYDLWLRGKRLNEDR